MLIGDSDHYHLKLQMGIERENQDIGAMQDTSTVNGQGTDTNQAEDKSNDHRNQHENPCMCAASHQCKT